MVREEQEVRVEQEELKLERLEQWGVRPLKGEATRVLPKVSRGRTWSLNDGMRVVLILVMFWWLCDRGLKGRVIFKW